MGNMLNTGMGWLAQQRSTHCASSISYIHNGTGNTVLATRGRTSAEVDDGDGMAVEIHIWDFLINRDDLGFDPYVGLCFTDNGSKYEVVPITGEGPWRWSASRGNTMRIHTKYIGGV
jgi:hypothetical protein